MPLWKTILGYIRRALNALNAAGVIPSVKPTVGDSNSPLDKPHDPSSPLGLK